MTRNQWDRGNQPLENLSEAELQALVREGDITINQYRAAKGLSEIPETVPDFVAKPPEIKAMQVESLSLDPHPNAFGYGIEMVEGEIVEEDELTKHRRQAEEARRKLNE